MTEDDVARLDAFAESAGLPTRSAAVQRAIRLLGDSQLEDAYAAAWDEWASSGDAADGDVTAGDGLRDAAG